MNRAELSESSDGKGPQLAIVPVCSDRMLGTIRDNTLAKSLAPTLPGRKITVVHLDAPELRELKDDELVKNYEHHRQLLADPTRAIVVVWNPESTQEYHRVIDALKAGGASPLNLFGLVFGEDGAVRLHQTGTECFVGFHDVRSASSETISHQSIPNQSSPEFGYEFEWTTFDLRLVRDRGKLSRAETWRDFLPVLPLGTIAVDQGEVSTPVLDLPLLAQNLKVQRLVVKDEGRNVTGSFKDRQTFVLINKAIEDGCKGITINSSGNAAISAAAYATKAGIQCTAVVPQTTSETKKTLIREFGAHVVERDGNYEENHRYLLSHSSEARNITPGATSIGLDGIKLIAYELMFQEAVPTVIIAPSGNGSLVAGLYKGFQELHELGLIEKIPKIVSAQMQGAAPLRLALEQNKWFVKAENIPDSDAEAIIAEESFSSPLAVHALKKSGGEVVEVTDEELCLWQQKLSDDYSIVSELSSAAAFAALEKLRFREDDVVVVVNTASGERDCVSDISTAKHMEQAINTRMMEGRSHGVEHFKARVLTTSDDFAGCEQLQREAFGFDEREVTPREVLGVIQEAGGLVIGLFDGNKLVAFSSALLGKDSQGLYLHSDLAAVQPNLQSQGLGRALKEAQRKFAQEMGFERIRWTYDPMLTKNANLNIQKLGARAVEFKRDVYGASSSTLYAQLPTHRFVVEWDLKESRTGAGVPTDAPVVLRSNNGEPHAEAVPSGAPSVIVEVPLHYLEVKDVSFEQAARWQDAFAQVAEQLFAQGYVVDGFEPERERGVGKYLFSRVL
jgi:threonine synthase